MASHSTATSSGPFTVMVSNLPLRFALSSITDCSKAHQPTSALFRAQPPRADIRPVPHDHLPEQHVVGRGSRCLSAVGIRFLGILVPPRASAPLTIGLPGSKAWTRQGYRVPRT
jgi:hypothetical protein